MSLYMELLMKCARVDNCIPENEIWYVSNGGRVLGRIILSEEESKMCSLSETYEIVIKEVKQTKDSAGLGAKYDSGKLMYHLVPWWANWILARLLTYGALPGNPERTLPDDHPTVS